MRVDWDLMRQIVLAVENFSTAGLPDIVDRSEEEVGYHAHLLIGNGLAEGFSVRNLSHRLPVDFISDLTVAGHEFAELARSDDRWRAAMTQAQSSGAVTLATLQYLLMHPPHQQAVPPSGKSGAETIHVIANKALTFLKEGHGGEQITVRPSNSPQLVPAWIRDTDTFRFAAKDGSVMEVEIKTSVPVQPTASQLTAPTPTARHGRSDFTSEEKRNSAVAGYTTAWDCSAAALARTARVDPADLSKWKKGSLPPGSEKIARIENAIGNNEPTPAANRPKNS